MLRGHSCLQRLTRINSRGRACDFLRNSTALPMNRAPRSFAPPPRRQPLHFAVKSAHTTLRSGTPLLSLRVPPACVSLFWEATLQDKVPTGLDRKESEVYRRLDPGQLPKHIAIIMDGNGRWAKRRHLPRVAGHRAGVASVRSTVETAARIHIPALTLYAFSEENWKKRQPAKSDF